MRRPHHIRISERHLEALDHPHASRSAQLEQAMLTATPQQLGEALARRATSPTPQSPVKLTSANLHEDAILRMKQLRLSTGLSFDTLTQLIVETLDSYQKR